MFGIFKICACAKVSNWTKAQQIANNNLNRPGGGNKRGYGNARTKEGRETINTIVNAHNAGKSITKGMLDALRNT